METQNYSKSLKPFAQLMGMNNNTPGKVPWWTFLLIVGIAIIVYLIKVFILMAIWNFFVDKMGKTPEDKQRLKLPFLAALLGVIGVDLLLNR